MRSQSIFLRVITWAAAIIGITILIMMTVVIFINGFPALKPDLFSWTSNSENVSLMPALFNTLFMIVAALIPAVPLSVLAAIFLNEYMKKGSRAVKIISMGCQMLFGIPSIVFGLFGSLFFVKFLHMGLSIGAGALTMVMMVMPLIIRTTQQALSEVDDSLRQASYGLGAGKARTIFAIVFPCALPGILNGIILATGRIVGESAALLFTAGSVASIATSLGDSGRTLAVHLYALSNEGLYMPQAWATSAVLFVITIVLNALSRICVRYFERKLSHE